MLITSISFRNIEDISKIINRFLECVPDIMCVYRSVQIILVKGGNNMLVDLTFSDLSFDIASTVLVLRAKCVL